MANDAKVVYTTETPWSVLTANFIESHRGNLTIGELLKIDDKWRALGKLYKYGFIGQKYI
jgi:hypothetical protein